jgi:hypothetical protein
MMAMVLLRLRKSTYSKLTEPTSQDAKLRVKPGVGVLKMWALLGSVKISGPY